MDGDYELSESMVKVAMMPPLSDREKALRDVFVQEYLKDYDPINAALRIGFMRSFAEEYSKKFMDEPYVQQRIDAIQSIVQQGDGNEDNEAYAKQRIVNGLMREAHYYGTGSSSAARVAALGKLMTVYGMDKGIAPANKNPTTANNQGGVMRVPEISDVTQWEERAVKTQQKLVSDVRS